MRVRPGAQPAPWAGLALGVGLSLAVTALLVPFRSGVTQATPALVLVLPVVAAGVVGGGPAAPGAGTARRRRRRGRRAAGGAGGRRGGRRRVQPGLHPAVLAAADRGRRR